MSKYFISGILTALCLSSPVVAKAPPSATNSTFDLRSLRDSKLTGEERHYVQVLSSALDALEPYADVPEKTETVVVPDLSDGSHIGYGFLDREKLHFTDRWHSDFSRTQVRHHQPILGIRLTQHF